MIDDEDRAGLADASSWLEEESFFLVRRHPLNGFTYVKGYANNVDDLGFEVVPIANESSVMFDSVFEAKAKAESLESKYGVFVHEECCSGHIFECVNCVECDEGFYICLECDYDESHRC